MFLRLLKRSGFSKSLITLLTGTTLAQGITLLISPILSRLFTPHDFGVFGTFLSIVSAIALIASLRYEIAIVLPKKEDVAINLLALAAFLTIIISILSFIGILLFKYFYPGYEFLDQDLKFLLFFIPVLILFIGFYQILNNYANRLKKYRSIVNYRVSNSLISSSVNIALGGLKFGPIGLLAGAILGNGISFVFFFKELYRDIKDQAGNISKAKMNEIAFTYREFPLVNSFQSISDMLQINGIIYFIIYFFNSFIVGSFSYALRILQAPMNLLGSAMAQIFYQQASELKNNGENLKDIVKKTMIKSAFTGLPIFLTIIIFGPPLFAFVFGETWREAGVYARILSPMLFFDFIRSPVSQVPLIIGRQKRLFSISLIGNFILVISMLYGGIVVNDITNGLMLFSVLQSLYTIFLLRWFYKIA